MRVSRTSAHTRSALTLENTGAVYTPDGLAAWTAGLLKQYLPAGNSARILDPACGDGILLDAVVRLRSGSDYIEGIDVDRVALRAAKTRVPGLKIRRKNALQALEGARSSYDGVIMNPPWGADAGLTAVELRAMGYSLAVGQFDTYELFVELALALLKSDGVLVAIIPDSLFLPEHAPLRRLLAETTEILTLARLGEGFFPGVFRGTTVLAVKKRSPHEGHQISCMRLTKQWRDRIREGEASLGEAHCVLAHTIPQSRFALDPIARFDIDVRGVDEQLIHTIERERGAWTEWFVSGRGVELSKGGRIVRCSWCNSGVPLPRTEKSAHVCRNCGKVFSLRRIAHEVLVRPIPTQTEEGWHPLIVGEDVDRYQCTIRREVRLGVQGINYKRRETFSNPKLLVRKTGLGIKAAIDTTGAFTNQVVFHYVARPGGVVPEFAMDYVLGVLNSRVLLAYYLKSLGETEWRSHPYVTQAVLAKLPVPQVKEGTWEWKQARAIADAVRAPARCMCPGSDNDLHIERLCAGLFGLTAEDCSWVSQVLNQTENMEPLRTLRLPSHLMHPVRVA
jgi:adenine-specific DNA-methyltransferase